MNDNPSEQLSKAAQQSDEALGLIFDKLLDDAGVPAAVALAGYIAEKAFIYGILTIIETGGKPGAFVAAVLREVQKHVDEELGEESKLEIKPGSFTCTPMH